MKRVLSARSLAAVALATGLLACEEHEFHPPDPAERVAAADSAYSPAWFDSIGWESEAVRLDAGNLVYADECRRCHGSVGEGNAEYARERGLAAPSLVRPEFEAGDDVEALRRLIFVGHPAGMPNWGIGRLTAREIDAAAYYVTQLRVERAAR